MAAAKVLRGVKMGIKVSDEAGTPTFAHPCLINAARAFEIAAETNSVRIPDCTSPELIAWVKREKISLSANISGAGKLHTTDTELYYNLVVRDTPIAVRVELIDVTLANGGGYFAGTFFVTRFALDGDVGDFVGCDLALESDGVITWVDAAA